MQPRSITVEPLTAETYQYLVQIQNEQGLESLAHAVQRILEQSRQTSSMNQLSVEHQKQLTKMMLGLEQCQTWLSEALLILHALTALPPASTSASGHSKKRKATTPSGTRKRVIQPEDISPLSLDQLRRGLTGMKLATRLGTSPAAVSRKRSTPDFGEWSQERDPAGVTWTYSKQTRRFHPILLSEAPSP